MKCPSRPNTVSRQRRLAGLAMAVVLAAGVLSAASPAAAVVPTADVPTTERNIYDKIWDGFITGVVSGVVDSANYFVSNMAYELASSIMGDCPGQKSCWSTKNWNRVLTETVENTAATMITTLADQSGLTAMGFDVCRPDLSLTLAFQLGLLDEERPKAPRCSFNDLKGNWESFVASGSDSEILNAIDASFKPGDSPLSFGLSAYTFTYEKKQEDERNKWLGWSTDKIAGRGFDNVVDPVSGRVLTPGSQVAAEMERAQTLQQEGQAKSTQEYTTAAIASRAVEGIAVTGVRVFVQTLTAKAWNKVVRGLLTAEEAVSMDPDLIFNPEAVLNPGLADVSTAIAPQYGTVKTKQVGEYDILSEFTVCQPETRGPYNCVMDSDFAAAVRMGESRGLTLAQAFEKGLIKDKPLIAAGTDKDRDAFCFRDAYCESNLKKLRAARVIPVGWEVAASLSPLDRPLTLKQAMDAFNTCGDDGTAPLCHLVDPNWVLKVPPLQCAAMGYGDTPTSPELATRREACVDLLSCLKQDDQGQCVGGWGYCTKEQHVWRFNADSCPWYANSCRTLTRGDGKVSNYLLNTMERGTCSSDNAGCRAYSTERSVVRCTLAGGQKCTAAAGCACTVQNAASACKVTSGKVGCTTPSGSVCTLPGSAACVQPGGCACAVTLRCRVAQGENSCFTTEGDNTYAGDDWQDGSRIFFSRQVGKCSAVDDGCSELIKADTGVALNLIRNGSFEELDDQAGDGSLSHARYWSPLVKPANGMLGYVSADGSKAMYGQNAVFSKTRSGNTCTRETRCEQASGCPCEGSGGYICLVPLGLKACAHYGSYLMQEGISVQAGRTYTFRVSTAASSAGAGGLAYFAFYRGDGQRYVLQGGDTVGVTSLYGADDGVTFHDALNPPDGATSGTATNQQTNIFGDSLLTLHWEFAPGSSTARAAYSLTFSIREGLPITHADLMLGSSSGVYFDGVQLEEGGGTAFHEGYNGGTAVNAKVPPAYLGCRGEENDPAACSSYAAVCRENEVGCESFRPTDYGPTVSGIPTVGDLCPAECVGYDTFKKQSSLFDGDRFPVHFIPSTARACPASEVGCSEFTNLTTEATATFSRVRHCDAPGGDDDAVFYTWEGSDAAGYQLKTWRFKRTAAVVAPDVCCMGGACSVSACSGLSSSERQAASADACSVSGCASAGYAPCTSLTGAELDRCGSRDSGNAGGPLLGYCSRGDIDHGDLDCREFYDRDGNRHYRRLSSSVETTDRCELYRITSSNAADCPTSGGVWRPDREECLYRLDTAKSTSCASENKGCRAYRGNFSGDVRLVIDDGMEGGTVGWSNVTQSSEAVTVGGHSAKIGGTVASVSAKRDLQAPIRPGYSYNVSFWARGSGAVTVGLAAGETLSCDLGSACTDAPCACTHPSGLVCLVVSAGARTCTIAGDTQAATLTPKFAQGLALDTEWRQYSIGPVLVPGSGAIGSGPVALQFSFTGLAGAAYLDNVVLRENRSDFFIIENSWQTPVSCDQTASGAASPQEMLGCRAYGNSRGEASYLRSLSRLCRDKAVGCAAYYDTAGTKSPYAETWNAVCRLDATCSPDVTLGGSNCPCTYASGATVVPDACRVRLGEKDCRFRLDAIDTKTFDNHLYPDRVRLPADRLTYLVVNSASSCRADAVGCRVVGSPKLTYEKECDLGRVNSGVPALCQLLDPADDRVYGMCLVPTGESKCTVALEQGIQEGWDEVAVLDRPQDYGRTLCREEALRCEEFRSADGTYYLKDPGVQVCEYREGVSVGGQARSGYFRKSASGEYLPCAPELLTGGNFYTLYRNADQSCRLPERVQSAAGSPGVDAVEDGLCLDIADGICPCRDTANNLVCFVNFGQSSCGYQGWVGQCEAQQNRCEEFVDRLSTSPAYPQGQPYYYLMNQKLDLTSCKGQASLVDGCVLLDRTGDLTKSFAAPVTYLVSQKTANGGMVTPANCGEGSARPECAKRCVAIMDGSCTCNPATDGSCIDSGDDIECRAAADCRFEVKNAQGHVTQTLNYGHCEGELKYGLACSDVSDCNATTGERCLANGDAYSTAFTSKRVAFSAGNDSNTVVKARLDRECSEWLSCESESPTWDEESGQYKSVCLGFQACSKNASGGDALECATVARQPRQRFTSDVYASRDTSWYGYDASGYSIIGAYPLSYVLPVNVVGKGCVSATDPTDHLPDASGDYVKTCSTTANCGSGYYCRQFEGLCKRSDELLTDRPCLGNSDCKEQDGEICARSYLATRRFGAVFDAGKSCAGDADCRAGLWHADDDGQCIGSRCVWRLTPGEFTSDAATAGACRAYPENDAPFPDSVLRRGETTTGNYAITDGYDIFGAPAAKKPDWSGSNVCTKANDCECDYTRVEYGQNKTRFYTYPGNSSGPVTYNGLLAPYVDRSGAVVQSGEPYKSVFDTPGVCDGGPYDGLRCDPRQGGFCTDDHAIACADDSVCRVPVDGKTEDRGPCIPFCGKPDEGGRCVAWSSVQYLRGWPGFCIDSDKATTVVGTADRFACNLWLPVEQLNGAPDLESEHREAGFNPTAQKLAYCTVAQGNARSGASGPVNYEPLVKEGTLVKGEGGTQYTPCVGAITGGTGDTGDGWGIKTYNVENLGLSRSQVTAVKINLNEDRNLYLSPTNSWWYAGSYADIGTATFDDGGHINESAWSVTGRSDGACECSGGPDHSTYAAVTFDGEILKEVMIGLCHRDTDAAESYEGRINVLTRESCEEIRVTHDTFASADFPSVAWTDKVFKSPPTAPAASNRTNSQLSSDARNTQPLGKITPFEEYKIGNTYGLDSAHPLPIWDSEGGSLYSVVGGTGDAMTADYGYARRDPNRAGELTYAVAGAPFASVGPTRALAAAGSFGSAQTAGKNAIAQLFVTAWRGYGWDAANDLSFGETYDAASDSYKYDVREQYTSLVNGPRVAAVLTGSCAAGNDGLCTEQDAPSSGQGSMTVNDLVTGQVRADSLGSLKASLKFYAYADKEHMPLRRLILDYGDGSEPFNVPGHYKNHRGCRMDAQTCDDQSRICGSSADFDKTAQACDDRYFSFSHTYRCSADTWSKLAACDQNDPFYPCRAADGTCRFKPRVQVMDNWGLCNGTCPGGPGGADGVCMNRTLSYTAGSDFNPASASFAQDECVYMKCTTDAAGAKICRYRYFKDQKTYEPWTAFDGEIVVPQQ
jgi:hypothetical protein